MGALLALASLTPPALALFFGLMYAAVAFLRPSDRKQTQLTVSTAAIGLWVLLSTVLVVILVAATADNGDETQAQDISLTGSYVAISLASGVMITLAVALAAAAFYSAGSRRNRLFAWSGLSVAVYYVLFLPSALGDATTPPALGSFWADPVSLGRILFGIIAGLTMAAAFWWHGGDRRDAEDVAPPRYAFREREYLLALAALLLLLSRLGDFIFVDWGSLRPADDQTSSAAVFQAVIFLAILLRLPVLFGSAALAFWTSARQSGWEPAQLLTSTDPAAAAESQLSRGPRLLLSWRPPLLLAWLTALIAATSFLGWYGLLVAAAAAAHYLRMTAREREITTQEE